MKTSKIMMAVVAVFISLSVMTAQVPAKKDVKVEPAKKECCDKTKTAEYKDAKATECKDAKKSECKDATAKHCTDGKAECCENKKAGECKDKKDAAAQTKSACCDKKATV